MTLAILAACALTGAAIAAPTPIIRAIRARGL